jgi:hypothetical protein
MTEGPRTVVAPSRLTEFDFLFLLDEMTIALQRISAAVRMAETERARLHGKASSIHEVMTAWRISNEVLEVGDLSLHAAHKAIMANTLLVGRALRATENDD